MKCPSRSASVEDRLGMNPETQRKFYSEEMLAVATVEVGPHPLHLAMQFMFDECRLDHVDRNFLIPFGSTGQ